jgi:hypothetical protein
MPQVFEENQGQAPENYRFIARRDGATAFYRPDGVDIVVAPSNGPCAHHGGIPLPSPPEPPELPSPPTIGR